MDILTKINFKELYDNYRLEIPLKKEEKEEVVINKNLIRRKIKDLQEALKYLEEEYEAYDPLYTYEECEEAFGAYTEECERCKRNVDYNDNQRGLIVEDINHTINEIELLNELLKRNITSFRLKKVKKYKRAYQWDDTLVEYHCNLKEKETVILHRLLNKYFARKDITLIKKGNKFFFLSEEEGSWSNPILLYLFEVN